MEFINKLKQLKNVYYNTVGSDDVMDGLDAALKGAEELHKIAKNNPNEMNLEAYNATTGTYQAPPNPVTNDVKKGAQKAVSIRSMIGEKIFNEIRGKLKNNG